MDKLNDYLFEGSKDVDELKLQGTVPPTYADAINSKEKVKKNLEKEFKDQIKDRDAFIKDNHTRERKLDKNKDLKKMHLSESLFESNSDVKEKVHNFVSELLTNTLDNLSQVVYQTVRDYNPDWCDSDGQSAVSNQLTQKLDQLTDSIVAVLFAENSELAEAIEYDHPEAMGRGTCAPLVFDSTRRIQQDLKYLNNEDKRMRSVAKKDLQVCIEDLMDQKQTVENFNTYWKTRYEASINFINAQLDLIPHEYFNESITEATAVLDRPETDVEVDFRKPESDTLYYKPTREPLAEIIMNELTWGETVYKMGSKGNLNPTYAPSLNLDEDNIGASTDDKGDYIIAWLAEESDTKAVEDIAKKYNRPYKSGYSKFTIGDRKYFTKIYVEDEHWEKPYVDPNVKIRPSARKSKVTA